MHPTYARHAVTKIDLLIGLFVVVLLVMLVVPSVSSGGKRAEHRAACLTNLAAVGTALTAYLQDSDQTWPCVEKLRSLPIHDPPWPTLPKILERYTAGRSEIFRCPADQRELSSDSPLFAQFGGSTTWWATEGASYEWLMGEAYCGRKVGAESLSSAKGFGMGRADMPLISEFEPFHEGDGGGSFNTLNADLTPRTARDNVKR